VLTLAALFLALACASPAERAGPEPRFAFQDSFWLNLHHFLRAEARRQARGAALALDPATLSESERADWGAGLAAYGELSQRNLLFDAELTAIKVTLAAVGAPAALPAGTLDDPLRTALNRAAPVYRAHLWPEHGRQNELWIAALAPLAWRHAEELVHELAAAYRVEWPELPILVDPSPESGPFLAYTTNDAPAGFSGQIVISSGEANRGAIAFECLAHEASHVVDAAIVRVLEEESRRQGVAPPSELWHALIFFTSGVIAERVLGAAGTYRADVEQGYPAYAAPLEQHWRAYLEERLAYGEALERLVHDADRANANASPSAGSGR
jgi:hypothetical protein